MPSVSSQIAFSLVALGMVLSPGPNMIYLISRSICQGRTAGMISLGGVALGFVFYMVCAALGITALIMAVPSITAAAIHTPRARKRAGTVAGVVRNPNQHQRRRQFSDSCHGRERGCISRIEAKMGAAATLVHGNRSRGPCVTDGHRGTALNRHLMRPLFIRFARHGAKHA
jgi:hypothetical protein